MRKIGDIAEEAEARRFADYLTAHEVEHDIEANEEGAWEVWIHDDARQAESRRWLAEFHADPDAVAFVAAAPVAATKQAAAARSRRTYERNIKQAKTALAFAWLQLAPVTNLLIFLAILISLLTGFGARVAETQPFLITQYEVKGDYLRYETDLPEIRGGQIWRLITPIFVHFGFLHLFFNIMWLRDLGTAIERNSGRRTIVALTLAIALLSNLAQFAASGPNFGGLSGVVYGLLGYAWLRGKYDLTSGLFVPPRMAALMGIWFLVCLSGAVGPIANIAHGVGLVMGLAWGYVTARWQQHRPSA
jgi:GlpG protein